jgi:hypothetical protein
VAPPLRKGRRRKIQTAQYWGQIFGHSIRRERWPEIKFAAARY